MKRLFYGLIFIILLLILSACDSTVYPKESVYICETPYIYCEYQPPSAYDGNPIGEMKYNGDLIKVQVYFDRGNTFSLDGDFVNLANHVDYRGTWKLEPNGDIRVKLYETYGDINETLLFVKQ